MSCKKLTFEEKEMAILRDAVDKAEERTKRASAMSPEITEMMLAVEDFLRKTKCICYGGTAINNILPVSDQFYDKNLEIPAYEKCIKASHYFNLLDARGVLSVSERASYIKRVREISKSCCELYIKKQEAI